MSHGTDLPSDAVATDAASIVIAPQDLNQGNESDDDGRVFDSMLVEYDNAPPTVPSTPPVLVTDPPRRRPIITRTMTGNMTLAAGVGPFLLMPHDNNRKNVVLIVTGVGAEDTVLWSDDPGKLQSPDGTMTPPSAAIIPNGAGEYTIDGHNGPVFVSTFGNAETIVLSWHTVTS